MNCACLLLLAFCPFLGIAAFAESPARTTTFEARTARSGRWSDAKTWEGRHVPRAGETVQIRTGHSVIYDLNSDQALRMVHVAGKLSFARDKSTRLDVGLLKIAPGEIAAEDGFNCHEVAAVAVSSPPHADTLSQWGKGEPAVEIGTTDAPIPANVTATIRLVYFEGSDSNSLPAIVNCGGRWDVHGAPLSRSWVKLGAAAKPGDSNVVLGESVSGWKIGDQIIVTVSKESEEGSSYRQSSRKPRRVETEERLITAIEGTSLTLDKPLGYEHFGTGDFRSEVANLSRNVVIESADPGGVRGHTMYHRESSGGISYAEFRHLGKEGLLGKYSIHFHLVGETMRGSGVMGASIWDSQNRWITIHGTDYLVVRDCVGYQSVGHGFFLEDGTEQYNLLERNLAVQAYRGKRLPKQVLPFDANDGAGFWWANGRNSFVGNVACENDEYGFRFEIAKRSDFNPVLNLRAGAETEARDVRTLPFYRFEANESHSEGLYSFNFGDDVHASVHGDRQHPFIARNLVTWETHYAVRPNVQYFLLDGFRAHEAAYGVYHPEYDAQVFRNIYFTKVNGEPINRGHDDESIQYGTFTYENLTLENCRGGRDPLIQLACTAPQPGMAGHFRNLILKDSRSTQGKVVDLGGGPRNPHLAYPVAYYFHDGAAPGHATKVLSAKYDLPNEGYHSITNFTGKDVRAADVTGVAFPKLLDPIDDVAPATMITSVRDAKGKLIVRGISHDNGEVASVRVNSQSAQLTSTHLGIADWEISLDARKTATITAEAIDRAGNAEKSGHTIRLR